MKSMLFEPRRHVLAVLLVLGLCWGCAPEKPAEVEELSQQIRGPQELTLMVVDDAAMAAAIEQLRAEWKARTGTNIVLQQMDSEQLLAAKSLRADAVIYPSRLLGTLAERGWIVPLPADFAENRELAWADTFELLQVAETTWAKAPHAVPFGSPVLTCYYRPDILAPLGKSPPRDWAQYHELSGFLADRAQLGTPAPPADSAWHGSLQPLAEGWAGRVLLARAASYAKHPDHFSTLFDIETMEPLIDGAAFVRALEELVADYKKGPESQLEMDPAAVRSEFLAGHAAMAITWPGHAAAKSEHAAIAFPPTGFIELPGSPVVYNFADKSWEKRHDRERWHVPLLSTAGRLGSVAMGDHIKPSFQLLSWLAGRQWGVKIAGASSATTLYRPSQVRKPQPWLDAGTDNAEAQAYASTLRATLDRQQYLTVPRIPGEAEYMAALDVATRDAVRGAKKPAEALAIAVQKWREVTEKHGHDAQKQAYQRSLGF